MIFEQRLEEVRKQDMGLFGRLVLKAKETTEEESAWGAQGQQRGRLVWLE